ncbi:expressed unknown protein [Seminavis robusta]|uniref:Transmembrane protein n=1 Tax=Seminavis robusta TaxID=568900 RepID=A0A9N8F0M3_9STRA|nr:expressed unknown protein [Seminavis robusta]|eukprot:Sro2979_g341450.1 n/a (199) ;mRNA; f:2849-3445
MAIDVVGSSSQEMTNTTTTTTSNTDKPRLLHDSLHAIPQGIRFPLAGAIGNVLFLTGFNACVTAFESTPSVTASHIYAGFFCCFIPVSHALTCLLVFGWPTGHYVSSLAANAPIGLTAMALGTVATGYFDSIHLEHKIDQFLLENGIVSQPEPDEERSEFYSSLVVMVITGIWSFVLSVYVNSSSSTTTATKDDKKEL